MTVNEFVRNYGITGVNTIVLREWGHKMVEAFLNDIQGKIDAGVNVNTPYKKLYDLIIAYPEYQTVEPESEQDPIVQKLIGIPLEQIQYYLEDPREYTKNKKLEREIEDLAGLYIHVPSNQKSKTAEAINHWQDLLKEKADLIVDEWKVFNSTFDLPQQINSNESPLTCILNAIKEYISFLNARKVSSLYRNYREGKDRIIKSTIEQDVKILDMFYNEQKQLKDISEELGTRSAERVRQIIREYIDDFLSGKTICHNLRLNRDLLGVIKNIQENCFYNNEETCKQFIGGADDELIKEIAQCDFVEIVDGIRFVVPRGTKGTYTRVSFHFLNCLREETNFVDETTVFSKVDERCEEDKRCEDYESIFIENLLSCDSIVEIRINEEENAIKYRLKEQFLATKEQRMARIIFDFGPISRSEAQEKYKERFKEEPSVGFNALSKLGINYNGNQEWWYGERLDSIQTTVKKFAEEKVEFYYIDVISMLEAKGYTVDNERSIRSYITELCAVDNKDRSHFCLKECVEDFPDFSWRNESREGITNWILNCIKDILEGQSSIDLADAIEIVCSKAEGTDFEHKIQQRAKTAIDKFSGLDQPFIINDNQLTRNDDVFNRTNFDSIGLKGGKFPFYEQIRSIIANEIKKAENGRIWFVDAIRIINENLDEQQDRNTIERALKNKFLTPINVIFEIIDGKVFLVRTKDEIATETNFEIKPTIHEDELIAQAVKAHVENRPSITARIKVNWADLEEKLKSELTYYNRMLQYEHIDDYETAVKSFLTFLKNAQNSNLSQKLPQNIFEYFFAQTDHFDRCTYLCNLCLFYEALLSELYYTKHGSKYRGNGLMDLSLQFPWTARNVRFMFDSKQAKGFDRIFNDLYHKRNRIAHGESVDLSSAETALKIADFIALYIMTTAKYV